MTPNPSQPRGIAGLTGREPIACALTAGKKGPNGAPIEKDRFHVLGTVSEQREFNRAGGGTYASPVRDGHPLFSSFNSADPTLRRVVPARLAHMTIGELFEYSRQLQTPPPDAGFPAHPKKRWACKGDGVKAVRWMGEGDVEVPCPGDQCPFTRPGEHRGRPTKPPCTPWMRFVARFDWTRRNKPLPNLPFKLTSGSWNTVRNFVGFFDAFERACRGFGVDPARVPLFGLPVLLTLTEQTNAELKSRFPVVSIQMDGEADIITWIGVQLERASEVRQLASATPLLALTDREANNPEVIAADFETISGPGLNVPGGK